MLKNFSDINATAFFIPLAIAGGGGFGQSTYRDDGNRWRHYNDFSYARVLKGLPPPSLSKTAVLQWETSGGGRGGSKRRQLTDEVCVFSFHRLPLRIVVVVVNRLCFAEFIRLSAYVRYTRSSGRLHLQHHTSHNKTTTRHRRRPGFFNFQKSHVTVNQSDDDFVRPFRTVPAGILRVRFSGARQRTRPVERRSTEQGNFFFSGFWFLFCDEGIIVIFFYPVYLCLWLLSLRY